MDHTVTEGGRHFTAEKGLAPKPGEGQVIDMMHVFRVPYAAMTDAMERANVVEASQEWTAVRRLGFPERRSDLRASLLRAGYAADLVEPISPNVCGNACRRHIENYKNHRIIWGRLESSLEPWRLRPEDYGLRPRQ